MDSKAIRTVVMLGVVSVFALTLLMMYSLDQMADTQTPQIAAELSRQFHRSLASAPPVNVRLTMARAGKGIDAERTYVLRIRPDAAVASDEHALARLMYRASEFCASELGEIRAAAKIRCLAELPEGGEKEATYVKDKIGDGQGFSGIHADVPATSPVPAVGAAQVPQR